MSSQNLSLLASISSVPCQALRPQPLWPCPRVAIGAASLAAAIPTAASIASAPPRASRPPIALPPKERENGRSARKSEEHAFVSSRAVLSLSSSPRFRAQASKSAKVGKFCVRCDRGAEEGQRSEARPHQTQGALLCSTRRDVWRRRAHDAMMARSPTATPTLMPGARDATAGVAGATAAGADGAFGGTRVLTTGLGRREREEVAALVARMGGTVLAGCSAGEPPHVLIARDARGDRYLEVMSVAKTPVLSSDWVVSRAHAHAHAHARARASLIDVRNLTRRFRVRTHSTHASAPAGSFHTRDSAFLRFRVCACASRVWIRRGGPRFSRRSRARAVPTPRISSPRSRTSSPSQRIATSTAWRRDGQRRTSSRSNG